MKKEYPLSFLNFCIRKSLSIRIQKISFSFLSLIFMAVLGILSTPPPAVTTGSKIAGCSSSANPEEAIQCYTNLINKEPANIDYYNARANTYLKMGKIDEALSDANKSISLNKHLLEAYHIRAKAYEQKAMYNEAIADYTKYVNGNKKNPDYLGVWGRGKCYYFLKQYDDAIRDFTLAIKIKADDINLYNWRADCYYLKNDYTSAAKEYETYFQKSEPSFNGLLQLGNCYVQLKQDDKAMHVYSQLSDLDPSIDQYFKGDHAFDLFNLDLRKKLSKEYLDDANIDLNEANTITSKSMLDIKLNDAFEKLQAAWGCVPNSTSINNDRPLQDSIVSKFYSIYSKLKTKPPIPEYVRKFTVQATSFMDDKNYSQAVKLYQRAISITPYYPLAHFNVAMLYATMKDYRSAIAYMKNYLKLAPDATDARAAQDKIYEWEVKVKN